MQADQAGDFTGYVRRDADLPHQFCKDSCAVSCVSSFEFIVDGKVRPVHFPSVNGPFNVVPEGRKPERWVRVRFQLDQPLKGVCRVQRIFRDAGPGNYETDRPVEL